MWPRDRNYSPRPMQSLFLTFLFFSFTGTIFNLLYYLVYCRWRAKNRAQTPEMVMVMQENLVNQMKIFNKTFSRRQRIDELRELIGLGDTNARNELLLLLRNPTSPVNTPAVTPVTTPVATPPAPPTVNTLAATAIPETTPPVPPTANTPTTTSVTVTSDVVDTTDVVTTTTTNEAPGTLGPRRRRSRHPQVCTIVCFLFSVFCFYLFYAHRKANCAPA